MIPAAGTVPWAHGPCDPWSNSSCWHLDMHTQQRTPVLEELLEMEFNEKTGNNEVKVHSQKKHYVYTQPIPFPTDFVHFCTFLKPPWSFPFLAFDSSPWHPIISFVQPPDSLFLAWHNELCTPACSNPAQSTKWSGQRLPCWLSCRSYPGNGLTVLLWTALRGTRTESSLALSTLLVFLIYKREPLDHII